MLCRHYEFSVRAGERSAAGRPAARPAGALLGARAVGLSGRPGERLHRPSDRDRLPHQQWQLPGHRERVEQPQLLCEHAGLQQRLCCESTCTVRVKTAEPGRSRFDEIFSVCRTWCLTWMIWKRGSQSCLEHQARSNWFKKSWREKRLKWWAKGTWCRYRMCVWMCFQAVIHKWQQQACSRGQLCFSIFDPQLISSKNTTYTPEEVRILLQKLWIDSWCYVSWPTGYEGLT